MQKIESEISYLCRIVPGNLDVWNLMMGFIYRNVIILSQSYHYQDHDNILNIVIFDHDKSVRAWNVMKFEIVVQFAWIYESN